MTTTPTNAPSLDQPVQYTSEGGAPYGAAIVHIWPDGPVDVVITDKIAPQPFKKSRVPYSAFRNGGGGQHSATGNPVFGPGIVIADDGTVMPSGLTLSGELAWTTEIVDSPPLPVGALVPVTDNTESIGDPNSRVAMLFMYSNPTVSGTVVTTPASGDIVFMDPRTALQLIIPTGPLDALTIALPTPIVAGQTHEIVITQAVTALSFTSSIGAPKGVPSSTAGYTTLTLRYVPAIGASINNSWVMIDGSSAAQDLSSYLTTVTAASTYTTQSDFIATLTAALVPYLKSSDAASEYATPSTVTSAISSALTAALTPYLKSVDAANAYTTPTQVNTALTAALASYLTSATAATDYTTPSQVSSSISAALTSALALYLKITDAANTYLTITNATNTYLPKNHPVVTGAYAADATGTVFRGLQLTEAGVLRWNFGTDQANGDLRLYYYTDAGVLVGSALGIARATGLITLAERPNWTVSGNAAVPWDSANLSSPAAANLAGSPYYVSSPYLRNVQLAAGVGTMLFSFLAPRAMTLTGVVGWADTGSAAAISVFISPTSPATNPIATIGFFTATNKASAPSWTSGTSFALAAGDRLYISMSAPANSVGSMDGVSITLVFVLN